MAQQEVRIIAHLSKDPALLDIFKNNLDFHSYTAVKIQNMPYTKYIALKDSNPKKFKESRQLAKKINFGLLYGMYPHTLKQSLDKALIFFPIAKVTNFWKIWRETYAGVVDYQNKMRERAWMSYNSLSKPVFSTYSENKKNYYYVTSKGGRIKKGSYFDRGELTPLAFSELRHLENKKKGEKVNIISEMSNFPIQATGSDILKHLMVKCSKEWAPDFARIVLVVHDEVLIETSKNNYLAVVKSFQKIITEIGESYLPGIGLISECSEPLDFWQ